MRGITSEPATRPTPAGAKTNATELAGRLNSFVTSGVASSPITSRSTPANESWMTAKKSWLLRRIKVQPSRTSFHTLCRAPMASVPVCSPLSCFLSVKALEGIIEISNALTRYNTAMIAYSTSAGKIGILTRLKEGNKLRMIGAKTMNPIACDSMNVILKSESAEVNSSSSTSRGIEAPSAGVKNWPMLEMRNVSRKMVISSLRLINKEITKPKVAIARRILL